MSKVDLRTFCCFIGFGKSRTKLVSAILDSHPQVVMADEGNFIKDFVADKIKSKDDAINYIVGVSEQYNTKKKSTYRIADSHQGGSFTTLKVIGDRNPYETMRKINKNPDIIGNLSGICNSNIRFIQCIRNPFDWFTLQLKHHNVTFDKLLKMFDARMERSVGLAIGDDKDICDTLYIDIQKLVDDPKSNISKMMKFLGLTSYKSFMDKAIQVIHPEEDIECSIIEKDQIDMLNSVLGKYEVLKEYRM
jgi:hypothetical protein